MNFAAILAQIKAFWSRYSLQQKAGMVVAGGMVVALLWAMVYFVNRVDYQALYSDLDPTEAQSIVTRLQGLQVPFQLSEDGRSVSVASDRISEVRIQLASEGLPESGRVGFEIFDRTNFGLTNFQEQVNYQRALEGELARSIMTLSEVAAARVHLVMPKDSLYQSAEDQTKASVILKLRNGRSLAASSVQGIVNVVASAVKGLSPDKVAVIDYRGKVLSRSEVETSLTGQQLDMRQKMETEMAAKIVQLLEPTVGPGKVRPQVSIAMNFEQVEETTEKYDPQGSVIRATNRQVDNGPISATGGIVSPRPVAQIPVSVIPAAGTAAAPATTGNNPAAQGTTPAANAGPQPPLRQNETTNYEVSKSVRHVVSPVGTVERLSVAVIVDNLTTTTTTPEGQTETKSTPRTPEEMKRYRDLVSAAIAFNTERGDQLVVENLSFENEVETVVEPTALEVQMPNILIGVRYLIVPLVFLLIYFLIVRPIQKTAFAPLEGGLAGGRNFALPRSGGAQTPMTVRQLESRLDGGAAAAAFSEESLPLPTASKMEVIRKRVVDQVRQDPENVARLVRVWLNEERNK
jgi:flagellar M-ring protein FliF